MAGRFHLGALLLAGSAFALGDLSRCCAQSSSAGSGQSGPANPAPCTVTPQPVPCGTAPAPAKPDSINRFPFPGETSGTADAPNSPSPTPGKQGSENAQPDAPDSSKPSGKNFPFPGETAPAQSGTPNESSSSSSSSSNDDTSATDPDAKSDPASGTTPGLKDKGSEGNQTQPGRRLLHRVNPIGTKLQTQDEREAEDLDVAHFYLQTGDVQGAYLRAQDAVKTVPDDPDAHFALAEIARKLNKRDEAITEYSACLKLDPDDKKAASARKELARLKQ